MARYSPSLRMDSVGPVTPVHSPHHSVHSSTSSRPSLRALTIHEYRKQQNSPASQGTPPGKTLRRKAAAFRLNGVERAPSTSPASRPLPRALHLSQSAHQLLAFQPLPPSPPHQQHDLSPDQPFRSQSAQAYGLGGSSNQKREFKPIKKLPKPLHAVEFNSNSTALLTPVISTQSHPSPLQTTSSNSFENLYSNDSQATPSSFSLSRFPQPPNLVGPSFSPLDDEYETPRVNTTSFSTTAPATPPATPAVVHYRGTSFDLVNPHDSLILEDIITPSREFNSSEYLPLRSSEDPAAFLDMAPKRPLYGDLSTAYESIARRNDETPPPLSHVLPLPPTPAAQSPGSSPYDSSLYYSPESNATVSPLSTKKPSSESRFSLKQLTQSLTKKIGKTSEKGEGEELQDFSPYVGMASASFEGDFPRPLHRSYHAVTRKYSIGADEPLSPVSPFNEAAPLMYPQSPDTPTERVRSPTQRRYPSVTLTSMIPDNPPNQSDPPAQPRSYLSEMNITSRPYYDDLASIYPSSSIYTNDDKRQSDYLANQSGPESSNPYYPMNRDAEDFANEYKSDSMYGYSDSRHGSRRVSRNLEREMFQRSLRQGKENTDTISKFIDEYKGSEGSNSSPNMLGDQGDNTSGLFTPSRITLEDPRMMGLPDDSRMTSDLSQFEFDFPQPDSGATDETAPSIEISRARNFTVLQNPGQPPSIPAPLAPAFEFDEFEAPGRPNASGLTSGYSSYGDTRQLLQLSQPVVGDIPTSQFVTQPSSSYSQLEPPESNPAHPTLQPSSSYSQPEALSSPKTPVEALDQAEKIFENAINEQISEGIPAMWTRRNSGNMLRNKSNNLPEQQDSGRIESPDGSENEIDANEWETVNGSQYGRHSRHISSGESIADLSDSEDSQESRDSLGFSRSFSVWEEPPLEPGAFQYQHPQPLGPHRNPFTTTPPPLSPRKSAQSARIDIGANDSLSPSKSMTAPSITERNHDSSWRSPENQEHFDLAPWTNPYALSEKETQELLASGPNEDILYDVPEEEEDQGPTFSFHDGASSPGPAVESSSELLDSMPGRDNSFDKITMLGPRMNMTGTPGGSGMNDAGSSVADNSSPGALLDSSPFQESIRSDPPAREGVSSQTPTRPLSMNYESSGFYAVPGRTGSVTYASPRLHSSASGDLDRTPSQATLFPRPVPEPAFVDSSRRHTRNSLRAPITPRKPRRGSRAAVPGQTKLRQMVLAPDAQTLSSLSHSPETSRIFGGSESERPSTSNTHTPLRAHPTRQDLQKALAGKDSPHLLCPERALDPEEEERRRKLSWTIFACFCILPPTLILYRWMGDMVIVNVTDGRITETYPRAKKIALGVGIAVNIGITAAILLPILIAHAAGAL